jgi:uncharacterized protein (DUF302 family)
MGRLERELRARGISTFAVIDHAKAARSVGLELTDEVVVLFGNPVVGTKLMQANPRVAIELPLRILIRDDSGTTTAEYLPPTSLSERFSLDRGSLPLDQLDQLLCDLADAIGG